MGEASKVSDIYTWQTNPVLITLAPLEPVQCMSTRDLAATLSHLTDEDGRVAWEEAKTYTVESGYYLQIYGSMAWRTATLHRPKPSTPEPAYIATQWGGFPPEMHEFRNFGYVTDRKTPLSLNDIRNGWPNKTDAKQSWEYFVDSDHSNWSTLAELLEYREHANIPLHEFVTRVSYYPTRDNKIIIIDLDDPTRNAGDRTGDELDDYLKSARHNQAIILEQAKKHGTYIEISKSGKGYHIFYRGTLPTECDKYELQGWASVYCAKSHLHMTGVTAEPDGPRVLVNGQEWIDHLLTEMLKSGVARTTRNRQYVGKDPLEGITTHGRRDDMTDEQVIAALLKGPRANKTSYYNLHIFNPLHSKGNWSDDTFFIIGDLDKITGDPDQIERILFKSPRMRCAGESGGVRPQDRHDREQRLFKGHMNKVRASNDEELPRRELENAERKEFAAIGNVLHACVSMPCGPIAAIPPPENRYRNASLTTEQMVSFLTNVLTCKFIVDNSLLESPCKALPFKREFQPAIENGRVVSLGAADPAHIPWINSMLADETAFFELVFFHNPNSRHHYKTKNGDVI